MIIAIDFDNTIVKEKYPEVGAMFLLADEVIKGWYEEGNHIIINTCRSGINEGVAYTFLKEKNIPFNYINCNLPEMVELYGMDCRKISCDVSIDDKNVIGLPMTEDNQVDWIMLDMIIRRHEKYVGKRISNKYQSPT